MKADSSGSRSSTYKLLNTVLWTKRDTHVSSVPRTRLLLGMDMASFVFRLHLSHDDTLASTRNYVWSRINRTAAFTVSPVA